MAGLQELNLERNEITDRGVKALADSKVITGLKVLLLERNDIDLGAGMHFYGYVRRITAGLS